MPLAGWSTPEDQDVVRRELEFAHPAEEEGIAGEQFLSVDYQPLSEWTPWSGHVQAAEFKMPASMR